MSDILRYDEHDTVTINFGNVIFANDKNMPYIDNCYIPLSKWDKVKIILTNKLNFKKMAKRKQPETSLAADREMTTQMRFIHFQKILAALNILGEANYEEISKVANLDKHAVDRRIAKMRELGWVETLDKQTVTSTGRKAFVHRALKSMEMPEAETESKPIVKIQSTGTYTQVPLFN